MLELGKTHALEVVKHVDFGLYLAGDTPEEEILLPERYLPEDEDAWAVGQFLDVFIYLDSEDRPIATTEVPYAEVGDCALLSVVDKGEFGSFLDWGLMKDLLVPFKEQRVPMEVGRSYVVYVYLDVTGRLCASSCLDRHLNEKNDRDFDFRQSVNLLVSSRSDLGYKAVINGTHLGLIHNNEVVRPIKTGDRFTGYIGEAREDGRINISLQKQSHQMRKDLSEEILAYLVQCGGSSSLTDKSTPDEIYRIFHASKGNYKKALGKLYREKRVVLTKNRIALLPGK
ncbi:MAG: GntR family transcriptional regulator [Alphaproteobacteria bacterium]|nr:MAG: GntR family transcriptional regulator [Alphaproteobacteria bacterium]